MKKVYVTNEDYVLALIQKYPMSMSDVCDRVKHRLSRKSIYDLINSMEQRTLITVFFNKNGGRMIGKGSENGQASTI